jgi:hypothetical protein
VVPGYSCDGNELPQIGTQHAGGIVFQVNLDGTGLVAAMEDLPSTYQWGCSQSELFGADGIAIGTGYQNTLDIVVGCSETNSAAYQSLNATIEDYTDWYLPSKHELIELYNTIGNGGSETNVGGFQNNSYWSSSEGSYNNAWYLHFGNGATTANWKGGEKSVRIIRSF